MFKHLLYVSIIFVTLIHCSSNPEYHHLQKDIPKLTGKIKGYNPFTEASITMVLPAANTQRALPIEINEHGEFEVSMEYPLKYRQGWFGAGEENDDGSMLNSYWAGLIINQGLHIEIDFSQDSTRGRYDADFIELSGPDAELNQYLLKYSSYRWERNRDIYQEPFPIIMRFNTPVLENHDTLLSVINHNRAIDSGYIENHPSLFSDLILEENNSEGIGLMNTLNWKGSVPKNIIEKNKKHMPTMLTNSSVIDFYNYQAQRIKREIMSSGKSRVKALRAQYRDNTDQNRFGHFVNELEKKYSKAPYDTIAVKNDLSHYSSIYKNEIFLQECNDYLDSIQRYNTERADILNLVGGYEDIWKQELYMSVAIDRFIIPEYKNIAIQEWAKDAPKIDAINEQLSNIQLKDYSNNLGGTIETANTGATLIETSITNLDTLIGVLGNRFQGKHIVLDVWATWCAPCINDMKNSLPNLLKLEERDIEVVYLCSSSSQSTELWKKKILEVESPKTHIYMTPKLSKEIMNTFKLRGYPSHVFIDRKGTFHEDVVSFIEHIDFDELDQKLESIN